MAQRAIQRDSEDPWTHFAAGYFEKYHPIIHEGDRRVYVEGLRAAGLR
jgi:hypothetical protein